MRQIFNRLPGSYALPCLLLLPFLLCSPRPLAGEMPSGAERALDRRAQAGGSDQAEAQTGLASASLSRQHYSEAVNSARDALRADAQGPLAQKARIILCRARAMGFLPGPYVPQRTFLARPWQERFGAAAAAGADGVPALCQGRRVEPRRAQVRARCSEAGGEEPFGTIEGIFSLTEHPDVARPQKLDAAPPVYTELARQARLQGVVILEAIIDQEGCVSAAHVLKPLPLGLDRNALNAVRRWVFQPAELYGIPVPVYYTLTVNFWRQRE
jgi:TonB family protein